jgi:aminoglycoside phosphotransferase (APT) family kinase protein
VGTELEAWIEETTGANRCVEAEVLQSLWSGYGAIVRYRIEGVDHPSVIVKHVAPPNAANHPRGWNTDRSHQRKLKSYQVETAWYQHYAGRCEADCRVPQCLGVKTQGDEVWLLLEDLDAAGYGERRSSIDGAELKACVTWLAHFHAHFLGDAAEGLWECGTYWHLETRPDELKRLSSEDPALSRAASAIDAKLRQSPFQSLVHGDAKLANFCFSPEGDSVAVLDFQYVGRGCGMKDLAYFAGSCFDDAACEEETPLLLELYFKALRMALEERGASVDFQALEADWRDLFPVAWTDFHRFLKGWSPGHWKIHAYSERLAREVIGKIEIEHS